MWLLLCSKYDSSALWAYQGLRRRGLLPLELVTDEMLLQTRKWEHRVGTSGVSISITLADGRVINNKAIRGTLNRLTHVPLTSLAKIPDYDYATQEYAAFFMSWLYALPEPIINASVPGGLSGAWRHASEWVSLAAQAGLPTPRYQQTSEDTIDEQVETRRLLPAGLPTTLLVVVGDRVVGPSLPRETSAACVRLAKLAQTSLLGIDLAQDPVSNSMVFAAATPMPDLKLGGEPLLDALAAELYRPRRNGGS
jgi:hypothetical protein